MAAPRKHADVIKAWADGAEVQARPPGGCTMWADVKVPVFSSDWEYRVKPDPYQHLRDALKAGKRVQYNPASQGWMEGNAFSFSEDPDCYRVIESAEQELEIFDSRTGRPTPLTVVWDFVENTGEIINARVKEFS